MKKMLLLLPFAAFFAGGIAQAESGEALTQKYRCVSCHKENKAGMGPSFKEVAKKYAKDAAAPERMAERVKKGSRNVWGPAPMPPNSSVPDEDIKTLIEYVMSFK
ncbi:MAG: c-type cytochrome [Burkholderiales bacterium]|jgi:cytochrome c|nr:c-type cytochrome [Burkholderiales bacterium]